MNDLEQNKPETEGQERHIQENTNFARIEPLYAPSWWLGRFVECC